MTDREFDVVLFGATGFTGGLTAEYLAANAPEGAKWAIAGRSLEKLEALRDRLGGDVSLLVADASDPTSLARVAGSTKVVATTVGPYIRYGEPLVAACAAAGTHYVDLTGEPEFVDTMYLRHHDRAVESGAKLIHACGFDSIPHDLGAQFCVEQLPEGVPLKVRGYVRGNGLFSGGTLDSATTAMSRGRQTMSAAKERKAREGKPADGRRTHGMSKPAYEKEIGAFALPLPTVDPQIILRSARAQERYGPDFTYGHYAALKSPFTVVGAVFGVVGVLAASQVPPLRRRMVKMSPPGTGPSEERRANSWFQVTFIGDGGGKHVVTEVSGGDPGYTETAKMLAESAMSLAFDELPNVSGQTTTAAALGPALRSRLVAAGMKFDVVSAAA
ncbi:MAG: saccharopine dehydrogenase NADP-binding domain-containing protein [Solirubrobacteraceae bacterium]|nr:saccharopine dehydrogenase NADP-binding domain-containing protein [Solirubrobacteraceae bacterium]